MSSFEDYFYKEIGNKIRHYRKLNGLTQEKLSELLDLNDKYIGHIERGERKISIQKLIHLIEFFHINPKDFFTFNKPYTW